jgi:hypothetical protein
MFKGVEKSVRQAFIDKVDLNLCWLLSVMERHYGPLPEPATGNAKDFPGQYSGHVRKTS